MCIRDRRGESIEFSPASSYHINFKDVTGLSDVRNAIYSTNSMGQDGDTYLGYRIESRDIDIVGYIKERDKQAAQNLRRKLNRILNPQYEATLTYVFEMCIRDSGYPVLLSDYVADHEAFLGDFKKVCANLAENIGVKSAYDIDTNSYKYSGIAIFDCAPAIGEAIVKLVKATT